MAEVAAACPGERITLGEMAEAFGDRAFGLLILIPVSLLIARSVVRRVRHMVEVLQAVERKDLAVTIDTTGSDEVSQMAQALSKALNSLRYTIGEVAEAATSLTAAAPSSTKAGKRTCGTSR